MKNWFQISALAMAGAVSSLAAPDPAKSARCVHRYNLAGVAPSTAENATKQVTRIFGKAGIAIRWEQLPTGSPEAHELDLNDSAANLLPSDEHPCLVVKITQELPPGVYPRALGFAFPGARFGIDVELVYRRIKSQADTDGSGVDVVLAYAMAHEIGHVLLRSSVIL
ncbi:MAG: hypothetical protein JO319_20245 [Acidobacteriaceae bacterium]|nr:hypothetical protein [Acidobacteriaceae bacterium]